VAKAVSAPAVRDTWSLRQTKRNCPTIVRSRVADARNRHDRGKVITLYQFPFSHFCEKARWALDHKGLAFTPRNLLPGLHRRTTRQLACATSLPILVDGGTLVQDSTAIITFLDRNYPDRPLTPPDPQAAQAALDWEELLDEEMGVPLRLWFYYHTLPNRRLALNFLLDGAPWYGRPLFTVVYPKVRSRMINLMKIDAESARKAERRLQTVLEKLDDTLQSRRYLAGNQFSRADLTACALLSPYCAPGKSDAEVSAAFPPEVCAMRDSHKDRPFFRWVLDTYRDFRAPKSERSAG
jgi:glutathione S-transferase